MIADGKTAPPCDIRNADTYWDTVDEIDKILNFSSKPFQLYKIYNTSTSQQNENLTWKSWNSLNRCIYGEVPRI